jgi:hypothetical protein
VLGLTYSGWPQDLGSEPKSGVHQFWELSPAGVISSHVPAAGRLSQAPTVCSGGFELLELVAPLEPAAPLEPVEPLEPVAPLEPVEPLEPVAPLEPVEPLEPVAPLEPFELLEELPHAVSAPATMSTAIIDIRITFTNAAGPRFAPDTPTT